MDQAKLEKKRKKREEKKKRLKEVSRKRLENRGALHFGAKEGDILALKQQVAQLTKANNVMAAEIQHIQRLGIVDKVLQNDIALGVLAKQVVEAKSFPIMSEKEFSDKCVEVQMAQQNLKKKPDDAVVENNDMVIIVFQVFDGEQLIHDEKQPLGYKVGSKGLPIDEQLIGMAKGETRYLDAVFEKGIIDKKYFGKEVRVMVKVLSIQAEISKQV